MSLVFVGKCIGVGLVIWGTRKLALAYRNDDAYIKAKAVPCLIVGALLYYILIILDVFGVL